MGRASNETENVQLLEIKELNNKRETSEHPRTFIWSKVVFLTLIHVFALYAVTLLPVAKWQTLMWTLTVLVISGFGVTAGAHRLWAHRTYKARLLLRVVLLFFNTVAFQNDLYEWCRDHRLHHKYSETDADPHNAKRGFFFSHCGWLMVKKHPDVKRFGKNIDLSDLEQDKLIMFQRKYYKILVISCWFLFPTFVAHYFWEESLWNAIFLAVVLRYTIVLNGTWSVNSVAHLWGSKPYDANINPAENLIVSFFAVGEGFHNFHHTFPQDYATSEFGWTYLNSSKLLIDLMAGIGLAYDLRRTPIDLVLKRKLRTGDGS